MIKKSYLILIFLSFLIPASFLILHEQILSFSIYLREKSKSLFFSPASLKNILSDTQLYSHLSNISGVRKGDMFFFSFVYKEKYTIEMQNEINTLIPSTYLSHPQDTMNNNYIYIKEMFKKESVNFNLEPPILCNKYKIHNGLLYLCFWHVENTNSVVGKILYIKLEN
jgi:hypothetical protein